MKNQRNMFFFINFVDKMIKIKLNKEHRAGLNTHRFVVGVVSHNKILSVNESQICINSNFFCSFPDLSRVFLWDIIL